MLRSFLPAALGLALTACARASDALDSGTPDASLPDAGPGFIDAGPPQADLTRDILTTALDIDLSTLSGIATVRFAPSAGTGASLEAGGLRIDSVTDENGAGLAFDLFAHDAGRIDLALPVQSEPSTVVIHYGFTGGRTTFTGLLQGGSTLTWPYFCGNVFPCHSNPADGVRFTLNVHGNDAGTTVIYPAQIPADAPSYQLAWATGAYSALELGTTDAGTQISAWARTGDGPSLTTGTAHLRDVFDWYEQHLGPYSFGPRAGPVDVVWPPGAYGGMEHHPYWHVSSIAIGDPVVHAHEAAHGWFGDGVRLRCWEDFVMSEGTVSYLAATVTGIVVSAAAEQNAWSGYQFRLDAVTGVVAWPDGCDTVDPLSTFNDGPYMKGAFFYRALAAKIGQDTLIAALHAFFMQHHGQPAGMQDVLDAVQAQSGYDPTQCAHDWLKSATLPADTTTCP